MRGRGYISCKEPLAFLGIRGKKNSHDVRSSSAVAQWQNIMIGPPLGVHTNQYGCTSSRLQRPGHCSRARRSSWAKEALATRCFTCAAVVKHHIAATSQRMGFAG